MNRQKRNFDSEAQAWDKPGRINLANDIATALMEEVRVDPSTAVLDFGCGTGLLSLRLQPFVRCITCVDSSSGMLEVLRGKGEGKGLTNIVIKHVDLDAGDTLEGRFDLVTSSMTLHHIAEIGPLLKMFYLITNPGGHLCIADLDPDGGRFHASSEGVFHNGIDRDALHRMFVDAGYGYIKASTAAEMAKVGPDGETRRFTIFLMSGRKQ